MTEAESFDWLQRFFLSNCDGEWEHYRGCTISTDSFPGWSLKFDLNCTSYADIELDELESENGPFDQMKCRMKDGVFTAFCGPRQLAECIDILRDVVEGRRGRRVSA